MTYFFLSKSRIIPSVNTEDIHEFQKIVNWCNQKSERVHLDVSDGKFVSQKTLSLNQLMSAEFKSWVDVHLMVKNPLEVLKKCPHLIRINKIYFHKDSDSAPLDVIRFCKENKIGIGMVLRTEMDAESIKNYKDQIENVIVMTVKLGEAGGQFLPKNLDKVIKLRELGFGGKIIVDGGITNQTIREAAKHYPDYVISGNYIFNSKDEEEIDRKYKELNSLISRL